jgi:hypothetical protein
MPTEDKSPTCRYGCPNPTHFCSECAGGISGLSGFYCNVHARRHDRIVRENGGSVFCEPIQPETAEQPQGVEL